MRLQWYLLAFSLAFTVQGDLECDKERIISSTVFEWHSTDLCHSVTLQRSQDSICQLELQFNAFDWGSNEEDCSLKIQSNGQLTDSICGKVELGKRIRVRFAEEANATIDLDFVNTDEELDFYYNITLRQILCQPPQLIARDSLEYDGNEVLENPGCGQTIRSAEFILQSPKYPRNYPDDFDCYTRVLPFNDNICSLELRFDEFRLFEDVEGLQCAHDYLEISGIDNEQTKPQRYCDVFTGIRLIEMGRSGKQFHFHSDGDGKNDVGYSILVRQLTCDLEPLPTTTESVLEDPEGRTTTTSTTVAPIMCSSYNPFITTTTLPIIPSICSKTYTMNSQQPIVVSNEGYEDCLYTIKTSPDTCSVQVDFKKFSVGTFTSGCLNDYLLINSDTKVCGYHSGTEIYPSYSSKFTMEFSGSGQTSYELIVKPIICSRDPIDSYGSPLGDPIGPYYPNDQEDSYGAPQAPAIISTNQWTPIYYYDTARPISNDYGSPTGRPNYAKPLYRQPKRKPHWLSPLRSIIRAKHRALKALFGTFARFTFPKPSRQRPQHKPKYRPTSKPLYYNPRV